MSIFGRLNRVFQSNINAALDKAENPEKLLAQTVLDMREEIKRAKQELVTAVGTAKRLEKKSAELEEEVATWEQRAVLALQTGDENLAREALKQKLKSRQKADDAKNQSARAETDAEAMKMQIEQFERKIDELEARKATLAAQVRKAREAPADLGTGAAGSGALSSLGRLGNRIDQMEAEVEAASVLDEEPKAADLDARFRALEKAGRTDRVDDELAALKQKLKDK